MKQKTIVDGVSVPSGNIDPTHKAALLREKSKESKDELIDIINEMLPIVEAAYYDEHTAGIIAGSGYSNKAEHLAGQKWGWKDSKQFKDWLSKVKKLTKKG